MDMTSWAYSNLIKNFKDKIKLIWRSRKFRISVWLKPEPNWYCSSKQCCPFLYNGTLYKMEKPSWTYNSIIGYHFLRGIKWSKKLKKSCPFLYSNLVYKNTVRLFRKNRIRAHNTRIRPKISAAVTETLSRIYTIHTYIYAFTLVVETCEKIARIRCQNPSQICFLSLLLRIPLVFREKKKMLQIASISFISQVFFVSLSYYFFSSNAYIYILGV